MKSCAGPQSGPTRFYQGTGSCSVSPVTDGSSGQVGGGVSLQSNPTFPFPFNTGSEWKESITCLDTAPRTTLCGALSMSLGPSCLPRAARHHVSSSWPSHCCALSPGPLSVYGPCPILCVPHTPLQSSRPHTTSAMPQPSRPPLLLVSFVTVLAAHCRTQSHCSRGCTDISSLSLYHNPVE